MVCAPVNTPGKSKAEMLESAVPPSKMLGPVKADQTVNGAACCVHQVDQTDVHGARTILARARHHP